MQKNVTIIQSFTHRNLCLQTLFWLMIISFYAAACYGQDLYPSGEMKKKSEGQISFSADLKQGTLLVSGDSREVMAIIPGEESISIKTFFMKIDIQAVYYFENNEFGLGLGNTVLDNLLLEGMKLEFRTNTSNRSGEIRFVMTL